MKIAVNKCFGGFELSDMALRFLESNHDVTIYKSWDDMQTNSLEGELWCIEENAYNKSTMYSNADELRTDPRVIDTVERLGSSANGEFAEIEIIEIPDGIEYAINDYDGIETIHEIHRSW